MTKSVTHRSLSLIIVVSAASLLLLHIANTVHAQIESNTSEVYDAANNIRKLDAFITACNDKYDAGDTSVMNACVIVYSQFNNAMEKLFSDNAAIFYGMVLG